MKGINNYTVRFYSSDEYPSTKNITAEEALTVMQAINADKKHIVLDGELHAVHQIISVKRNFEAERDETYGKKLTSEERHLLDARNIKHGVPALKKALTLMAERKSMPAIKGSAENPEL